MVDTTVFLRAAVDVLDKTELAVVLNEYMACKMASEHAAGHRHFECPACTMYADRLQTCTGGSFVDGMGTTDVRPTAAVHIDSNTKVLQVVRSHLTTTPVS